MGGETPILRWGNSDSGVGKLVGWGNSNFRGGVGKFQFWGGVVKFFGGRGNPRVPLPQYEGTLLRQEKLALKIICNQYNKG